MLPVYFSFILISILSIRNNTEYSRFNRINTWAAMFACFGLLLSFLIPIAVLPEPHGPFKTATTWRTLTDSAREEIFASKKQIKRRLPIQIWYPCGEKNPKNESPQTKQLGECYMQSSSDFASLIKAPLPSLLASHLHLIKTHSIKDLPVAKAQSSYPLIIFSHGLMGGRIQNTMLCENLASYGFIVIGIDHTYDAAFSIFPNGSVICSQLLTGMQSGPTIQGNGFDVRIRDVISVLNWASIINEQDPDNQLTRKIDLQNVGVIGHSFGGSTSFAALALDSRVKAAVNMEGTTVGVPPCQKPAMVMQADHGDRDALGFNDFEERYKGELIRLKIFGTGHANFTDLPMLTPLHAMLLLSGPIEPQTCEKIIENYSLDFFKHHLKHEPYILIKQGDVSQHIQLKIKSASTGVDP